MGRQASQLKFACKGGTAQALQINTSAAAPVRAWPRIPFATQPLRLRNSNRKGDSARPGLEPEPCGRERRAQRRAPELSISSHGQVPVSDANRSERASLRGKQRPRQNGVLKNGTYRTRPGRQASQLKFACRSARHRLQISSSHAQ